MSDAMQFQKHDGVELCQSIEAVILSAYCGVSPNGPVAGDCN